MLFASSNRVDPRTERKKINCQDKQSRNADELLRL